METPNKIALVATHVMGNGSATDPKHVRYSVFAKPVSTGYEENTILQYANKSVEEVLNESKFRTTTSFRYLRSEPVISKSGAGFALNTTVDKSILTVPQVDVSPLGQFNDVVCWAIFRPLPANRDGFRLNLHRVPEYGRAHVVYSASTIREALTTNSKFLRSVMQAKLGGNLDLFNFIHKAVCNHYRQEGCDLTLPEDNC